MGKFETFTDHELARMGEGANLVPMWNTVSGLRHLRKGASMSRRRHHGHRKKKKSVTRRVFGKVGDALSYLINAPFNCPPTSHIGLRYAPRESRRERHHIERRQNLR